MFTKSTFHGKSACLTSLDDWKALWAGARLVRLTAPEQNIFNSNRIDPWCVGEEGGLSSYNFELKQMESG